MVLFKSLSNVCHRLSSGLIFNSLYPWKFQRWEKMESCLVKKTILFVFTPLNVMLSIPHLRWKKVLIVVGMNCNLFGNKKKNEFTISCMPRKRLWMLCCVGTTLFHISEIHSESVWQRLNHLLLFETLKCMQQCLLDKGKQLIRACIQGHRNFIRYDTILVWSKNSQRALKYLWNVFFHLPKFSSQA